jgi:hypothetical protein
VGPKKLSASAGLEIMSEIVAAQIRTEQPAPGLQGILDPMVDLAVAASQRGEPSGKKFLEAEATDITSSSTNSALLSDPHKHAADSGCLICSVAPRNTIPFSEFSSTEPLKTAISHKIVKSQHIIGSSSQEHFRPLVNDQTDTNYRYSEQKNHVTSRTTYSRRIHDRKGKGRAEPDSESIIERRDLEIVGNGEWDLELEEVAFSSGQHTLGLL